MKRKNLFLSTIVAFAMVIGAVFGIGLVNENNKVQKAYALSDPISVSNVYYFDGFNDVSFGTTMPTGYTFSAGTLTIADGATPYTIWTEGAGMLAVKFEGNYGNNTVDIANNHGKLTLTSTTSVNVTLAGLYSSAMMNIEGKVNLTITGPSNAGFMNGQFSKFLVGCPNGTLYVYDDASVTAIDPVLHGATLGESDFEAIFKVGDLALNTTGCFKVGLNTTPTSTDEAYAIKVIDNGFSPVNCTKCDNGFVLYSNANKFICEGDDATDPDNFDYQTELAKNLKTIEDGNSLTIRRCQVSFDANTGSGTMDNESSYKGNYSLPNCSFTAPSGKQFKCWAVGSAGGTQYNAGANYTITDDVTFYAVWEDAVDPTYTITYHANGGTGADYVVNNIEDGSTYTMLTRHDVGFFRLGYTFAGWAYTSDGAVINSDSIIGVYENKDLYAVWSNSYTAADEMTPLENVQLNHETGVISWDAFAGATDYYIEFDNNGGLYTGGASTFDLDDVGNSLHRETGDHYFGVYAVDGENNKISKCMAGNYYFVNSQTPLASPTGLAWDGGKATWTADYTNVRYYYITLYKAVNDEYVTGQTVYSGNSYSFSSSLSVNVAYYFTVEARAKSDDLEHTHSAPAQSENKTFVPVVAQLQNVTISDGRYLSFDLPTGTESFYVIFYNEFDNGGARCYSLPVDLYEVALGVSLTDGTYSIKIENFLSANGEPLAPDYVYDGSWVYDSAVASALKLTGTVVINGDQEVAATLTAVVSDSNSEASDLIYTWVWRNNGDYNWTVAQTGASNIFVVPSEIIGKIVKVVVTSSTKNVGSIESNETGYILQESLKGTATITGEKKFGSILTASLVGGNNTGELSYVWKRDGIIISGATSSTYTLVEDDIGSGIRVEITSSVQRGTLQSAETDDITKADGPAAPTGLTASACTNADNNDGQINGVSPEMEYKLSTASGWTDVLGVQLSGLTSGTYFVRYKETSTQNASENAVVVVNVYNAPVLYSVTVNGGIASEVSAETGTTITLTANEAEEGYVFDKWVANTENVTFTDKNSTTTTFTMPAGNVIVTATYKLIPVTPDPEPETPAASTTNNGGGISAGAVIGIILAVVIVGGCGGFAVVWFVVKKKTWADFVALFKKK